MNRKTKLLATLLCALSFLGSCTNHQGNNNPPIDDENNNENNDNNSGDNEDENQGDNEDEGPIPSSNTLTAYFSCTNNTEGIAEKISSSTSSILFEILPTIPYTSADLNYNDQNSRANKEQNDPNARPEIKNDVDLTQYSTIFLGYPIRWGRLPKIIYTFLDSYDFANKTIIPFATSGSSGISTSVNEIKSLEPLANVLEGRRFPASSSQEDVDSRIKSLNL